MKLTISLQSHILLGNLFSFRLIDVKHSTKQRCCPSASPPKPPRNGLENLRKTKGPKAMDGEIRGCPVDFWVHVNHKS